MTGFLLFYGLLHEGNRVAQSAFEGYQEKLRRRRRGE
jgi:hypothetical protein